jgi:apolipoprotein N-acyltransferase
MSFRVRRRIKALSWALLSPFLLVLSFPEWDLGFLAWIALLPLLLALRGKNVTSAFFFSFFCGIVFFLGVFHWILQVPKYTGLHHALLAIYLGSYFGLFGMTFNFVSIRSGVTRALFAAPFLWVSLEYFRSNFSFLALPWALLAHSQYQYPPVIQIASLTGTYGISFLIVLVNAVLAALVLPASKKRKPLILMAASLAAFTWVYGQLAISRPIAGDTINVSLIQGNIEQSRKWDPRFADEIMRVYAGLTREASKEKPDLIIWPETATPGSIALDRDLNREVRAIAQEASAPLLLGSAHPQKFKQEEHASHYYNSAYLIFPHPCDRNGQRYDKIRLFPFGEYLPYEGFLPWHFLSVMPSARYLAGKEWKVFDHPSFRFGVTVCWENLFPDLFRKMVSRGAQFMVNITNEAHFGKTAAPYQLAAASVFRAVEHRVFVVRCANTGISCVIDPYGRIVNRVQDQTGRDSFIRGRTSAQIAPLESRTFYTLHGDWFVWLAITTSVVFLVYAGLRKPSRKLGS